MEAMECIKTRRSVRKFTQQPVTEETISQIVATAAYAPSWKNTQTVRYIAVIDSALKQKLADTCMLGFEWNQQIVTNAAAVIILTTVGKRSGYERDGSFSTKKGTHWQSFDAGIAAQTFCLSAHSLGLGTVILGIYDEEKTAEKVGVPEGESISALIAIGYPEEIPAAPKRKEIEQLLSYR